MTPEISALLEDLYQIDPTLREQEKQVVVVVERLLANRPTPVIDEQFRSELRERLQVEFSRGTVMAKATEVGASRPWFKFLRPWQFALAGSLLTAVVVIPLVNNFSPRAENLAVQDTGKIDQLASAVGGVKSGQIHAVADQAFGSLASSTTADSVGASATAEKMPSSTMPPSNLAYGRGGGANNATAPMPASLAPEKMAVSGMPAIDPNYRPEPTRRFEFVYEGRDFELPGEVVQVLKAESALDAGFDGAWRGLLGPLAGGDWRALQIESFTVVEDRPQGYSISLNPRQGEIFINPNWQLWPTEPEKCREYGCNQERLRPENFPADADIMAVAAKFIGDLNLSIDNYGAPFVDGSWRLSSMSSAADSTVAWTPDHVSVRYPLLVEGKSVYDDFGNQAAMDASVDIMNMKVSNLNPIQMVNYQAANYPAVTDTQKILELVRRGGPSMWSDPNAEEVVAVKLGEPTLAYAQRTIWNGQTAERLLIPVLVFPILDQPTVGWYGQQRIVIPLAAELLEQNGGGVMPVPTPLMLKSDAGEVSVGATPASAPAAAPLR